MTPLLDDLDAPPCSGCTHDPRDHEYIKGCQIEGCKCPAWPVTGQFNVFDGIRR